MQAMLICTINVDQWRRMPAYLKTVLDTFVREGQQRGITKMIAASLRESPAQVRDFL
jgi:hypothetical protein